MTFAAEAAATASPQGARETDRMLIARAAHQAALAEPGVVVGDDGGDGRYATLVDSGRLAGIVVVAERGGRYGVDLYLTAALVPLGPLAERVRKAVGRSVRSIGLEQLLGPVNVSFLGLDERAAS